eukprot:TRINITY_DN25922_c0_g1_i1.p1 TRINITY_DN25922_c0_g1~~TRINITY_DN25922_c0_g1_i1.p1  ORF type:complete len:1329 (+),score=370.13 TRINITY_DN25922_c0_g1_i1:45-4031(+)
MLWQFLSVAAAAASDGVLQRRAHPLSIVVAGARGCGKSSLINSVLKHQGVAAGAAVQGRAPDQVGTVPRPVTVRVGRHCSPAPSDWGCSRLCWYDTPGSDACSCLALGRTCGSLDALVSAAEHLPARGAPWPPPNASVSRGADVVVIVGSTSAGAGACGARLKRLLMDRAAAAGRSGAVPQVLVVAGDSQRLEVMGFADASPGGVRAGTAVAGATVGAAMVGTLRPLCTAAASERAETPPAEGIPVAGQQDAEAVARITAAEEALAMRLRTWAGELRRRRRQLEESHESAVELANTVLTGSTAALVLAVPARVSARLVRVAGVWLLFALRTFVLSLRHLVVLAAVARALGRAAATLLAGMWQLAVSVAQLLKALALSSVRGAAAVARMCGRAAAATGRAALRAARALLHATAAGRAVAAALSAACDAVRAALMRALRRAGSVAVVVARWLANASVSTFNGMCSHLQRLPDLWRRRRAHAQAQRLRQRGVSVVQVCGSCLNPGLRSDAVSSQTQPPAAADAAVETSAPASPAVSETGCQYSTPPSTPALSMKDAAVGCGASDASSHASDPFRVASNGPGSEYHYQPPPFSVHAARRAADMLCYAAASKDGTVWDELVANTRRGRPPSLWPALSAAFARIAGQGAALISDLQSTVAREPDSEHDAYCETELSGRRADAPMTTALCRRVLQLSGQELSRLGTDSGGADAEHVVQGRAPLHELCDELESAAGWTRPDSAGGDDFRWAKTALLAAALSGSGGMQREELAAGLRRLLLLRGCSENGLQQARELISEPRWCPRGGVFSSGVCSAAEVAEAWSGLEEGEAVCTAGLVRAALTQGAAYAGLDYTWERRQLAFNPNVIFTLQGLPSALHDWLPEPVPGAEAAVLVPPLQHFTCASPPVWRRVRHPTRTEQGLPLEVDALEVVLVWQESFVVGADTPAFDDADRAEEQVAVQTAELDASPSPSPRGLADSTLRLLRRVTRNSDTCIPPPGTAVTVHCSDGSYWPATVADDAGDLVPGRVPVVWGEGPREGRQTEVPVEAVTVGRGHGGVRAGALFAVQSGLRVASTLCALPLTVALAPLYIPSLVSAAVRRANAPRPRVGGGAAAAAAVIGAAKVGPLPAPPPVPTLALATPAVPTRMESFDSLPGVILSAAARIGSPSDAEVPLEPQTIDAALGATMRTAEEPEAAADPPAAATWLPSPPTNPGAAATLRACLDVHEAKVLGTRGSMSSVPPAPVTACRDCGGAGVTSELPLDPCGGCGGAGLVPVPGASVVSAEAGSQHRWRHGGQLSSPPGSGTWRSRAAQHGPSRAAPLRSPRRSAHRSGRTAGQ